MTSGVYEIFNRENGKRYIGSAANIERRWKRHRGDLKARIHHAAPLQRAWTKYGESAFSFRVILTCAPTRSMLVFYEQQLLNKARPEYNVLPNADSRLGSKPSAETKKKMSEAQKRRHAENGGTPAATKKKIGAANKAHAAARSVKITHCPRGHEYTEANTYHGAHNSRSCRTCAREHMRAVRAAKKVAATVIAGHEPLTIEQE